MKIDKKDIDALLLFFCNVCDICEKKDRKIVEEVLYRSKNRLEKLSETTDIDVEYFLTYVLSELGTTYYYYEGVKKGYGFKTFISHVKRTGVLAVMSDAHANNNERALYGITYKEKKYYLNNKNISQIELRKKYFFNRRFLSNECFIIDSVEMEKINKAIGGNKRFCKNVDARLA